MVDHPGARLVYFEGPLLKELAIKRERQLKRRTRAKKLALITNQIGSLSELSRSREKSN
jgi:predicted GIY-YIG superfamily endonuclease